MSLESKIEMLTAAIDRLNANMTLLLTTPADQVLKVEQTAATPAANTEQPPAPATTAESNQVEHVAASSFTQDDLRRLCMTKVKEDRAFKDTLKDFLSRAYGVTKTSDVPDDKVQEAYTRIESGNLS